MGNENEIAVVKAVAAPLATVFSTALPLFFSNKDKDNASNAKNQSLQNELNNQRIEYNKQFEKQKETISEYDKKFEQQANKFREEIEYIQESQNMRIIEQNNQIQQLIEQQKQKENEYQNMLKNQEYYFQNAYNILLSEKSNKEEILNQQMEQLKQENNYKME